MGYVAMRPETLLDALHLWHEIHGHTLKDSKYRMQRTTNMIHALGNPRVEDFTAQRFAQYRTERLKTVTTSTVNHEMRYLRAVLNELIRFEYLEHNPLDNVRQFSVVETELSYLDKYQIETLLDSCRQSKNKSLFWVVSICLKTGSRWNEAEGLKSHQIVTKPQTGIRYLNTKNGRNRFVPVDADLISSIKRHVVPNTDKSLFTYCRSAFRSAVKRAGLDLPDQQMTHVLRHTFASHFLMNGGDLFMLQRILGHQDIKTTMRYSHFAPEYLNQALDFSPDISKFSKKSKSNH